jgi:ferritin-like metal-binding protein YciE
MHMKKNDLHELYVEQLRDLYSAENQLVKALPKMAEAATTDELRTAFEEHLEQTQGHVQRLETIFENLGEKPAGEKCKGMEGLVKEGSEVMGEDFEGALMDAALIGAAQRVEHYEIAAYGTVAEFAKILGEDEHVSLLEETLQEEKDTDEKLTSLANEINPQANEEMEEEEEEPKIRRKSGRRAA